MILSKGITIPIARDIITKNSFNNVPLYPNISAVTSAAVRQIIPVTIILQSICFFLVVII